MSAKLFRMFLVIIAVCALIPMDVASAEWHTEAIGVQAAAPNYSCNDMSDTFMPWKGLRRGITHDEVVWLRSFVGGGGQAIGLNQEYIAAMLSIPAWQVQYFMAVFRLSSHVLLSNDRNNCGIYLYISPFWPAPQIWTEPQMP